MFGLPWVVPAIMGGLNMLGRASKGSAEQRRSEYDAAQQAARDLFMAQMDSARFQRDNMDRERRNAVAAALLRNMQDVNVTGMSPRLAASTPTISGGARPSALTGGGQRDALLAVLARPSVQAPTFTPAPFRAPGKMEKIFGALGTIGGIGSAAYGGYQDYNTNQAWNDYLDRTGAAPKAVTPPAPNPFAGARPTPTPFG